MKTGSKTTLDILGTPLGERGLYDAVSQCSRCGYCEQACPTYVETGRESFSARGRNQIVRLMLEGRLEDAPSARRALETCLLCGACQSACPAQVPTAEIVLEGRRRLGGGRWAAAGLSLLFVRRPAWLKALVKTAYGLRRLGLDRLAAPALRAAGLGAAAEAARQAPAYPERFVSEGLSSAPRGGGRWAYFAACGPEYLFPAFGRATWTLLTRVLGRGCFPGNGCCGLPAYNYGALEDARELARRAVLSWERAGSPAPLVADCSSCAAFLKSYPQLFPDEPGWRDRARRFAVAAKDALEVFPESAVPRLRGPGPVTYHDSCRARHGAGIWEAPRRLLRRAAGELWTELPEADVCCGGAGAYAFAQPELSGAVLRRKAEALACVGARVVAVSSTSCLLQLAGGLKKYYPECRVVHWTQLFAEAATSWEDAKT